MGRVALMYSSHHAAVGVALTVAGYHAGGEAGVAVAAVLAFLSHDPLDRIGEAAYGRAFPFPPDHPTMIWEGVPLVAALLAAVMAGPLWWVIVAGWVAGVLMDIIDKGLLAIGWPEIFPCHHRTPDAHLTLTQTKALAVAATAWFIAAALLVGL